MSPSNTEVPDPWEVLERIAHYKSDGNWAYDLWQLRSWAQEARMAYMMTPEYRDKIYAKWKEANG